MRTVAALFIDNGGPYPTIPGVECWFGWLFDAFRYAGPHPVVAHPPCGPWGKLAHFTRHQEARGGPFAVELVRTYGGVVEHPVGSRLWPHCSLPAPGAPPDAYGGRTLLVDQCEWGHVTRKASLLYVVGLPEGYEIAPPFPGREPTHAICNGRGQRLANGTARARATALQARLSPRVFAEQLVTLARASSSAPSSAIPFEGPRPSVLEFAAVPPRLSGHR